MGNVELALRLSISGVLLLSGAGKARSIADTVGMWAVLLRRIRPGLRRWDRHAAWALVVVELLVGVLLLVPGRIGTAGAIATVALMAAFCVAAALSALGVMDVKCACFGSARDKLGWRHFWRNTTLLAIAASALFLDLTQEGGTLDFSGILIAVTCAIVISLSAAFQDRLAALIGGNW